MAKKMARDFSAHHKEQNDKTTNQWGDYEISRAKKVHWGVPRKVNSSVNTFTSTQQNTTIWNIQQRNAACNNYFSHGVYNQGFYFDSQLRTPVHVSNGLTCDVTLQLTKCCIILLSWCTNRFSTIPSMFTGGLGKNSNQCWHQFAAENWSFHDKKIMSVNKVEVLVSGHPRNAEKVFVTGTGRLREWFSYAATRGERVKWPFKGACPAIHKN